MEFDFSQFSLSRLIERFFNLRVIGEWIYMIPSALLHTLMIASIAEVLGVTFGLVVAFGAIDRKGFVRALFRGYTELFRGTPLLVQILFIHFSLPLIGIRLEPFVSGCLALSLNSAAYVAEIFRAGIESIDKGQVEASRSLGMSYGKALRVVVVPQALRRVVPPLTNEFVVIVKDSSLVAVIGVTELLRVAQLSSGATFNASMFTVVALAYLSITLPLTFTARRLEARFGRRGSQSWLEAERSRRKALREPVEIPRVWVHS